VSATGYALQEGNERGGAQIPGLPKATGATTGMNYGDAIFYDRATDKWKKATSASLQPIGFCGNTDVTSETYVTDNVAGTVTKTFVRGTTDADASVSVIVSGIVKRVSEGVIPAGELVMLSGTNPLTHVKAWDGTSIKAVVGRYVVNITNHHPANAVPASANADEIKIEVRTVMGTI
jgi:hypothetical protein